jgi:hypothetical protein
MRINWPSAAVLLPNGMEGGMSEEEDKCVCSFFCELVFLGEREITFCCWTIKPLTMGRMINVVWRVGGVVMSDGGGRWWAAIDKKGRGEDTQAGVFFVRFF